MPWAIAAAVAAVVSAGVGVYSTVQAGEAQEEANKAAQAEAAVSNRRKRTKMLREMQALRAGQENVQAGAGATTSAFFGTTGAMASSAASNVSDFNAMEEAGFKRARAMRDLGKAEQLSSIGAAIGALGTAAGAYGQTVGPKPPAPAKTTLPSTNPQSFPGYNPNSKYTGPSF